MAGETLLLVEDSDDDVFLMKRAFQKARASIRLDVACDGPSAIKYLAENPLPSLVLLDLNLPVQSGLEILRAIRSQPRLAALPIYVFSASIRNDDETRALEAGATGYLVKPSGTDELVRLAERLHGLMQESL